MTALVAYGSLFLSAFIAATLFPAQSEIVLIALINSGEWSVFWLVVVASVGNTLGSVVASPLLCALHRRSDLRGGSVPERTHRQLRRSGRDSKDYALRDACRHCDGGGLRAHA